MVLGTRLAPVTGALDVEAGPQKLARVHVGVDDEPAAVEGAEDAGGDAGAEDDDHPEGGRQQQAEAAPDSVHRGAPRGERRDGVAVGAAPLAAPLAAQSHDREDQPYEEQQPDRDEPLQQEQVEESAEALCRHKQRPKDVDVDRLHGLKEGAERVGHRDRVDSAHRRDHLHEADQQLELAFDAQILPREPQLLQQILRTLRVLVRHVRHAHGQEGEPKNEHVAEGVCA
mmetsp:Transcript_41735/g.138359  ORF Transcript_41735/g.138359 Transcript_41735/m.138359 type:complete len:228 (-) Transcript_41735:938-1621(-)